MEKNAPNKQDMTREFEENPYNPDKMTPEDVMRLFFSNDLPIIPVISRTGISSWYTEKKRPCIGIKRH